MICFHLMMNNFVYIYIYIFHCCFCAQLAYFDFSQMGDKNIFCHQWYQNFYILGDNSSVLSPIVSIWQRLFLSP